MSEEEVNGEQEGSGAIQETIASGGDHDGEQETMATMGDDETPPNENVLKDKVVKTPLDPTKAVDHADTNTQDLNTWARAVTQVWGQETSIHGCIFSSDNLHYVPWMRLTWTILTLATAGGLIATLVRQIDEFQEYKISTSISIEYSSSMQFPQVIVCNTNQYDASLQNATGIKQPSNEEELIKISQPFENFILHTEFNNVMYDNLTAVWDPVVTPFGLCYKFETKQRVLKPGIDAGLFLVAWLDQENYDASTDIAGLALYITQPGATITDQTTPVFAAPGLVSVIGIRLVKFDRERQEPWKRCIDTAPEYSTELCRFECMNRAVREICACRMIGDHEDYDLRFCNSSDSSCVHVRESELDQCDCSRPPCKESAYEYRHSSAVLTESALNRVQFGEEELVTLPAPVADRNLVSARVNFDVMQALVITESKSTSYGQLISNLGGDMGFFMGMSILAVVEVFDLVVIRLLLPVMRGDRRLYGLGGKY